MGKLKKYLLLTLLASLSLIGCSKYKSGGSDANGFVLSTLVGNAVQGQLNSNCVVSINNSALTYGAYVNMAINSGRALGLSSNFSTSDALVYSAFTTLATNTTNNITLFTAQAFKSVVTPSGTPNLLTSSGTTTASVTSAPYYTHGDTVAYSDTANSSLAFSTVPYTARYDAFWGTGTSWTKANRNALLNFSKQFLDAFTPFASIGYGNLTTSNYLASTMYTTTTAISRTAVDQLMFTLVASSSAALASACNGASNIFQVVVTRATGASTSAAGLTGTNLATCDGGLSSATAASTLTSFITLAAGLGNFSSLSGTATLLCTRIPAANCNLGAVTTASQATDITNLITQTDTILSETGCRQPSATFSEALTRAIFRGYPIGSNSTISPVLGFKTRTAYQPGRDNQGSTTTVLAFDNTANILAANSYPKFGALVSLGFASLMPIKAQVSSGAGATIYPNPLSNANAANDSDYFKPTSTQGGNISFSLANSCEGLGLAVGPTINVPSVNQKPLTTLKEVAYAFSNFGVGANFYYGTGSFNQVVQSSGAASTLSTATIDGVTYQQPTTEDMVACNNALRTKAVSNSIIPSTTLVPGTFPTSTSAVTGDGFQSELFSMCVYGGTSAGLTSQVSASTSNPTRPIGYGSRQAARFVLASGLNAARAYGVTGTNNIISIVPECGTNFPISQATLQYNAAGKFGEKGVNTSLAAPAATSGTTTTSGTGDTFPNAPNLTSTSDFVTN